MDNAQKLGSLSIVVVSCDRYADIWPHFFQLFHKYWPDCPYQVFLGSNHLEYNDQKVTNILTGDDFNWADSTKKMIEMVPTEYLLMILEDFFIRKPVDTEKIANCLVSLKELNGGYLRLRPFPKPDHVIPGYPEIGLIDKEAPYRLCLQAAIWRKELFLQLVQPGESAWDMEINGSKRSNEFKGFYCTWDSLIKYRAGITLGKWAPIGVKIMEEENMQIDYTRRSKMTPAEIKNLNVRIFRMNLLNLVPWKLRRRIKKLFIF